jgi:hypothetical protein
VCFVVKQNGLEAASSGRVWPAVAATVVESGEQHAQRFSRAMGVLRRISFARVFHPQNQFENNRWGPNFAPVHPAHTRVRAHTHTTHINTHTCTNTITHIQTFTYLHT